MILEDQLTHAERIRLEALNQAQQTFMSIGIDATSRDEAVEKLFQRAERIEKWLRQAREDA